MTTPDNPPAVSEAAKAKATELLHGELGAIGDFEMLALQGSGYHRAFARFIQQASDAAKGATEYGDLPDNIHAALQGFILPDPVDGVQEAIRECGQKAGPVSADDLREALAKHGLEIREVQP